MVVVAATARTTEIAMANLSAAENPVAKAALAAIAAAPVAAEVPADTAAFPAINCNVLLNLYIQTVRKQVNQQSPNIVNVYAGASSLRFTYPTVCDAGT
jgi:hypothetical protein